MQETIDASVAAGDTVNNEFYLDTIPNRLVQAGAGRSLRGREVRRLGDAAGSGGLRSLAALFCGDRTSEPGCVVVADRDSRAGL